MAVLTRGITLGYKADGVATTYTDLTNLQEIPDLGNNAPDKIDITVLSDSAKKSMDGLADSAQDLEFTFLYEDAQFTALSALTGQKYWKVTLPDGTAATFTGSCNVKLGKAKVSEALIYTLTVSVDSLIAFA